jgi:hypothetical protein
MQVVTGARQVGKTTLVTQVVESARLPYVFASADEPTLRGSDWIDAQWEAARLLGTDPFVHEDAWTAARRREYDHARALS